MSDINFPQFREILLEKDRIPRKLNENAEKQRLLFLEYVKSGKIKTEEVTSCACGCADLEKIAEIDRFGLPFGALICKKCGLVITSPRIASESLPEYYDKFYHVLNYGHLHVHDQHALFRLWQGNKIYRMIKPFLADAKELSVLEIGAGTGNVLTEFTAEAEKEDVKVSAVGTEYSTDCIEECRQAGINIIYGDLDTMVNEGGTYDVLILSHVFEHFTDLTAELEKVKKLLKPQGVLYIEVPGLCNVGNIATYNFDFLEYLIHAHMYNFNKTALTAVLAESGFECLASNEKAEAVFRPAENAAKVDTSANYSNIMGYLEKLVFSREFLKDGIENFSTIRNNLKDDLSVMTRWHEHEKSEAEKFSRWHTAEKERGDIARRWHEGEKKVATELMQTLDAHFKTPYTSVRDKMQSYRKLRDMLRKNYKRYFGRNSLYTARTTTAAALP
jgi:2-polyprenyl-3-methyl-5-hydroxy-6-metoxy-1,4-benzoquinol methylase